MSFAATGYVAESAVDARRDARAASGDRAGRKSRIRWIDGGVVSSTSRRAFKCTTRIHATTHALIDPQTQVLAPHILIARTHPVHLKHLSITQCTRRLNPQTQQSTLLVSFFFPASTTPAPFFSVSARLPTRPAHTSPEYHPPAPGRPSAQTAWQYRHSGEAEGPPGAQRWSPNATTCEAAPGPMAPYCRSRRMGGTRRQSAPSHSPCHV